MYELIILSFLMRNPMHGYLIAKILNDIIGPFAKVSNGRLYPLLAKLQEGGLIVAEKGESDHHGDRRQRAFAITDTGQQRFHQLMMDTTSNPGEYQRLFWLKLPSLEFLQPIERLYLLDHYLNYCQAHIFHFANEMDDLVRRVANTPFMTPEQLEATLCVMRHSMKSWQLEIDHVREWRTREVARAEGLADAPASLVK
jgi:DNA-binding PadR family transcriptional regulator